MDPLMDTKSLPTTALAVQAQLRAEADFRGIDEDGQVHYLYGMATARLASTNAKVERLLAALKALVEAWDADDDTAAQQASDNAKSAIYITEEMGL